MTVEKQIEMLIATAEQKKNLLEKALDYIKAQAEYMLSEKYDKLKESLKFADQNIEKLKVVNMQLDELQLKLEPDMDNAQYAALFTQYHCLGNEIARLLETICQMSDKNNEFANSMLCDMQGQIKQINLTKKGYQSYNNANSIETSLYFDQNR